MFKQTSFLKFLNLLIADIIGSIVWFKLDQTNVGHVTKILNYSPWFVYCNIKHVKQSLPNYKAEDQATTL